MIEDKLVFTPRKKRGKKLPDVLPNETDPLSDLSSDKIPAVDDIPVIEESNDDDRIDSFPPTETNLDNDKLPFEEADPDTVEIF